MKKEKRKWIRKIALLLSVVLICSMIGGTGVFAQYYERNMDVRELEQGDCLDFNISLMIPSDYEVTINGYKVRNEVWLEFNGYMEIVDRNGYAIISKQKIDLGFKDSGNFWGYLVETYSKDEEHKTIDISLCAAYRLLVGEHQLNNEGIHYVKAGSEVTLTASVPKEYQPYFTKFGHWNIYGYEEMGLSEEDLSQMSVSFIMPKRNLYISYDYYINTISGNALRKNYWDVDTSWLGDIEVTVEESEGIGESVSDSSAIGIIENNVVSNIVQTTNGDVLTSEVPIHFVAGSVTGVVPVVSGETVNYLAGLDDMEVQAGAKAKFYIGDVYRSEVKKSLREAAGEKGTIMSMLDIDLYTIGKNGIQAVRNVEEPISMVIGIPQGKQAVGREYSLVYIKDGNIVEVKDKDSDIKTITVDLDYFGAYALIYK